jgi:hypothetical protein
MIWTFLIFRNYGTKLFINIRIQNFFMFCNMYDIVHQKGHLRALAGIVNKFHIAVNNLKYRRFNTVRQEKII